jgi:ATP-dependent RNA helicase HelY
MPPSIHPVDLIDALRQKNLTPAIVFLTSRRACDEAMESFDHTNSILPPARQEAIAKVLEQVIAQYPSIASISPPALSSLPNRAFARRATLWT